VVLFPTARAGGKQTSSSVADEEVCDTTFSFLKPSSAPARGAMRVASNKRSPRSRSTGPRPSEMEVRLLQLGIKKGFGDTRVALARGSSTERRIIGHLFGEGKTSITAPGPRYGLRPLRSGIADDFKKQENVRSDFHAAWLANSAGFLSP